MYLGLAWCSLWLVLRRNFPTLMKYALKGEYTFEMAITLCSKRTDFEHYEVLGLILL